MKAVAYLRVSTEDQSVENQLPAIQAWCQSHGYELGEVFQENESAWKSGRQLELQRLIDDCRNGKRFDYLVVWALDRLSRQGIAALLNRINMLKLYGVKVVSINESWTESEGPMKELLFAVFAWAAEYESKIKSERTLAGLARARANGKSLGRPKGSHDKQKRNRRGYLLRYADRTIKKTRSNK